MRSQCPPRGGTGGRTIPVRYRKLSRSDGLQPGRASSRLTRRRKVLTRQLRQLEHDGSAERKIHHQFPQNVEYSWIPPRRLLRPAMTALCTWGEARQQSVQGNSASRNTQPGSTGEDHTRGLAAVREQMVDVAPGILTDGKVAHLGHSRPGHADFATEFLELRHGLGHRLHVDVICNRLLRVLARHQTAIGCIVTTAGVNMPVGRAAPVPQIRHPPHRPPDKARATRPHQAARRPPAMPRARANGLDGGMAVDC